MKSCYLCGNTDFCLRPGRVRDQAELDVLECQSCGLVFLSSFEHITAGFYENSRMHAEELPIDKWVGQTAEDDERRFQHYQSLIRNRTILDFGCGAGGFLARAQKIASLAVGVELEKRLKPHFEKEHLTVFANLDEIKQSFDVITLFHVLEHQPDPVGALQQLIPKMKPHGCLIIEVPNADDALLTLYRSDAFSNFSYWSCHLFLFNTRTLAMLARQAGLQVDYIKQTQRYPLSNHLYWLAKQLPEGHLHWGFLDSKELHMAYEKQLGMIGCCDTLLASFSLSNE